MKASDKGIGELNHHVNRKLWNKAIDLIDNPMKRRTVNCTDIIMNGCATSAPAVFLQLRRAMLRHDWVLVRLLLANCYLSSFRSRRDTVHKVLFQILLSSPASNRKIVEQFCRMYLGVGSEEEIDCFLKVISTVPNKLPEGTTRLSTTGKLYVSDGDKTAPADAYSQAVQHMFAQSNDAP